MNKRRALILILTLVLAGSTSADHPARERGFKAENVYQFNDLDTVNLMNGNLILNIPLGGEYPVAAGLSYSFVLRYSGNVWSTVYGCRLRMRPDQEQFDDGCVLVKWPQADNGGMGWRLAFGELLPPESSQPGTQGSYWQYRSADGATHLFYDTLREPACASGNNSTTSCDEVVPTVKYSRDGTYLRLKQLGDVMVVEFQDGMRQRFRRASYLYPESAFNPQDPPDWRWVLEYIYGRNSAVDSGGTPVSNYVRFSYVAHDPALDGKAPDEVEPDWMITDSHTRTHHVRFTFNPLAPKEKDLVHSIELEAFGSTASSRRWAAYNLTYHTPMIRRPCVSESAAPINVAFLETLALPSGETFRFDYVKPPNTNCDDANAAMVSAVLPTGGAITWSYQKYRFSDTAGGAIGVKERMLFTSKQAADGFAANSSNPSVQPVQWTSYAHSLDPTSVEASTTVLAKVRAGATWGIESRSVNYHVAEDRREFGLPFSKFIAFDGNRALSSVTYDCEGQQVCGDTKPVRKRYVRYEADYVPAGCDNENSCGKDTNRRVVSEWTSLFWPPGPSAQPQHTDVEYSDFDGLGHYRATSTTGTFAGLTGTRSAATNYNNGRGTYTSNVSGRTGTFTMLDDAAPWLLNLSTLSSVTENAKTTSVDTCFDPTTGFLERTRTFDTVGGLNVLTRFTCDAASGHSAREEYYQISQGTTSPTCTASLPSAARQYRIDHTYASGALQSSQYYNVSTDTAIGFFSEDYRIDNATGLVKESRDPSGLATLYDYDSSRRLSNISPPGVSSTVLTYQPSTATVEASATVRMGAVSSLTRTEQVYRFDFLGRPYRTKTRMPGNFESVQQTTYDSLGRRATVSEAGRNAASANVTTYSNYDVLGRPGVITAPDNSTVTFTYEGTRRVTRKQRVATGASESDVYTSEEYDSFGRLSKVTEDSAASQVVTSYGYDTADRLVNVTQGAQVRTFVYDARGFLTSETHPESGSTTYEYDARGHVTGVPPVLVPGDMRVGLMMGA